MAEKRLHRYLGIKINITENILFFFCCFVFICFYKMYLKFQKKSLKQHLFSIEPEQDTSIDRIQRSNRTI